MTAVTHAQLMRQVTPSDVNTVGSPQACVEGIRPECLLIDIARLTNMPQGQHEFGSN